ncbi:MAG: leucyl aminopeptidase [Chloroflexi bacterium]|nr:leucyl aminopeptidase [Chloroflexota bacterium]
MDIRAIAGDIVQTKADAIIVDFFEGTERLDGDIGRIDKALDGGISQLISQGEVKGKLNEVTIVHTLGKLPASRVAVVGLGKQAELSLDRIRGAMAEVCRRLREKGAADIATAALGAGADGISPDSAARDIAEGALLGVYSFRKHMTKEAEHGEIKQLTIVASDKASLSSLQSGGSQGKILAEATNLARDMVNEPANYMTPTRMAEVALELARTYGLKATILEREQMQELGMGALLGVAQGSKQPPKLITLLYKGRDSVGVDITLVGKGITFDSGGISIKPSEGMADMKGDMAGGAVVLAAISAIAQLRPKLNVMAIAPAAENMPGGSALKPGDVVTAMNGKTVEIISTDGEGRLILADALCYARQQGARFIVDVATLTGACRVALGDVYSGAFGNDQDLVSRLIAAGAESGELFWQLPMHELYREQLKSEVADLKNVGNRWGGAITAAHFLAEFVGDTPWVHLDIAGTGMLDKERGYWAKGGTGIAVRTLTAFVLSVAKQQ